MKYIKRLFERIRNRLKWKRAYPVRDPIKDYFPLPKEIFTLGLTPGEIAVYSYLMYIENQSILMDVKLVLLTARTVFQPESTEGFDQEAQQKMNEKTRQNEEQHGS